MQTYMHTCKLHLCIKPVPNSTFGYCHFDLSLAISSCSNLMASVYSTRAKGLLTSMSAMHTYKDCLQCACTIHI